MTWPKQKGEMQVQRHSKDANSSKCVENPPIQGKGIQNELTRIFDLVNQIKI